jgi:predicted dehydrogenase
MAGIDELEQQVKGRGLVAYVGYQMRFHPCLRRLHALLSEGSIGKVLTVRAEVGEYLPNWHNYEDYRQSYAARRELGGGALLSQIHEFDYLYWFFGLPRKVFTIGGHLSSLEVDVEDVASTLMEFQTNGHRIPVHLQQDYVQRPPSRTCQVIGDAGKILIDLNALSLHRYDASGQVVEETSFPGFQRNQLFLDELSHFIACVNGGERPLVDLHEGAQSLRMALAAKESLETGEIVTL